jgi:hypothetical protein
MSTNDLRHMERFPEVGIPVLNYYTSTVCRFYKRLCCIVRFLISVHFVNTSLKASDIIRTFVLFEPKEVFGQPITVLQVLLNHRSESTSKTRALC